MTARYAGLGLLFHHLLAAIFLEQPLWSVEKRPRATPLRPYESSCITESTQSFTSGKASVQLSMEWVRTEPTAAP